MNYFSVCSSPLFFLKEICTHPHICRDWKRCLEVERLSRSELLALQEKKLQKLLHYAVAHVPFYRGCAAQKGWDCNNLRIEDFPIIDKSVIRGHEEEFVSDEFAVADLECCNTSGSTGEPFRFYANPAERTYTYASFWRGINRFGIRPGDRRVWVKGVDLTAVLPFRARIRRKLWSIVNRCMLVDAHFLSVSPERIGEVLKAVAAYRPEYFHGYSSSIYDIARYIAENGFHTGELFPRLKAVVAESEKLYPDQRKLLEQVFQVPILENYGSVEFGMIAQPDAQGIMCLNEDHIWAETDIEGDAVFTNLDYYAFPFIRFKNGDKIRLSQEKSTNLPFRKVEEVLGRVTEKIRLPNGGVLQAFAVTSFVYDLSEWIRCYQFVQTDIRHLVLKIVPAKEKMPAEIEERINLEVMRVTEGLLDFRIEFVDQIPLTRSGKRMFVVSQL